MCNCPSAPELCWECKIVAATPDRTRPPTRLVLSNPVPILSLPGLSHQIHVCPSFPVQAFHVKLGSAKIVQDNALTRRYSFSFLFLPVRMRRLLETIESGQEQQNVLFVVDIPPAHMSLNGLCNRHTAKRGAKKI